MRNLKKVLSLALAMVMLLGMMVVGAGAATSFKDDDSIPADRQVAAAVANKIEVLIGDDDGNFNPDDTLTRAEAAVILARLDLGATAASALTATDAATFTDVAAGSGYGWAKPFIDYCAGNGYMVGVGDNRFAPAQTLTSVEFGLMISRVLGYRDANEGVKGAEWSIKAAALARKAGLGNDVAVGSNPMTRADMAQMVLNALQAPMVEYEGMDITIGDVAITSKATNRTHTGSSASGVYNTTYDGELIQANITPIRLCEEKFPDLKLVSRGTRDAFYRTYSVWTWKKVDIAGTRTLVAPDAEFTAKTTAAAVSAQINGATGSTANLFVNGKAWEKSNDTLNSSLIAALTQNGRQVQVFLKADDHKTIQKVVVIDTYVGRVNSITKDGTDDRYITLAILGKTNPNTPCAPSAAELAKDEDMLVSGKTFSPVKTFDTDKFAANDLVTYRAAYAADGKYYIQEVDALEVSATATLEKWTGYSVVVDTEKGNANANFTAGGVDYKYSINDVIVDEDGLPAENDIASFTAKKSEINIYLDQYGYVIYVSGVETPKNYAAVIGVGESNQYGSLTRGATLLLPDGTKKEVTARVADEADWLKMDNNAKGNKVSDGFAPVVTYSESDNVYTLTVAYSGKGSNKTETGLYNENNSLAFTNGKSEIVIGKDADGQAKAKSFYTTDKTVFMICSKDSAGKYTYSVYTGYANMPSVKWEKVTGVSYALNRYYPNQVDAIYINGDLEGMANYSYFVINRAKHPITTVDNGIYNLPAVVDGEKTTIQIKATTAYNSTTTVDELDAGLYVITDMVKDSNGVITACRFVDKATAFKAENGKRGTIALDGTVLGFGQKDDVNDASYWAYSNNTKVFTVEEDYSDLEAIDIKLVPNDKNDLVYAGRETDERKLTTVFIVDQDDDKVYDDKPGNDEVAITVDIDDGVKSVTVGSTKLEKDGSVNVTKSTDTDVTVELNDNYKLSKVTLDGKTLTAKDGKYTIKASAAATLKVETESTKGYTLTLTGSTLIDIDNTTVANRPQVFIGDGTGAALEGTPVKSFGTVTAVTYKVPKDAKVTVVDVDGIVTNSGVVLLDYTDAEGTKLGTVDATKTHSNNRLVFDMKGNITVAANSLTALNVIHYDATKFTVDGNDPTNKGYITKNDTENGVLYVTQSTQLTVTAKNGTDKAGVFGTDTDTKTTTVVTSGNDTTGLTAGYIKVAVQVARGTGVTVTLNDTNKTAVAATDGVIPGTPLLVSVASANGTGVIEGTKPGANVAGTWSAAEATLNPAVKVNLHDGITAKVGTDDITETNCYVEAGEASSYVIFTADTTKGTTVLSLVGDAKHASAEYNKQTGVVDIDLYMGIAVGFTTTGVTTGAVCYQTKIGEVGTDQTIVASSTDGNTKGYVKSGTTLYIYGVPSKTADITAGAGQVEDLKNTGAMKDTDKVAWTCTAGIKDITFAQAQ